MRRSAENLNVTFSKTRSENVFNMKVQNEKNEKFRWLPTWLSSLRLVIFFSEGATSSFSLLPRNSEDFGVLVVGMLYIQFWKILK